MGVAMTHECKQERRIDDAEAATVRHAKEIYEGREGRQPIIVRMDRCERIVNMLTYVSTVMLVSVLLAAGSLLWNSVVHSLRSTAVPVHSYEPGNDN